MEFELSLPYDSEIEESDKTAIESYISKTINQYKDNTQMLTKFAMEASFALSVGESRSSGLANQGFFKNLWGGITGKNRKIRGEIDYNFAVSQRASQQMIKTLAEQNKLTFDAVVSVNSKLNMLSLNVDKEFNDVYKNIQAIGEHVDKNIQAMGNM